MAEQNKKKCGAQLRKKPGVFCKKTPIKGKRRCRLHGGRSLAGVASGAFKHGRYSRYLPKGLRKQYEQTKHDPQLLSHEPDLRLMDVRLQNLLNELGKSDPRKAIETIKASWGLFQRSRTVPGMNPAEYLDKVGEAILAHQNQANEIWDSIERVTEQRRKLLESETRRIQQNANSMSGEQILALIEYIVDVLRESVQKYADRLIASKILNQVTTDIGVVVSRPDQASPETARLLS